MLDAYVIEVSGRSAGIVARDSQNNSFRFYSAVPRFPVWPRRQASRFAPSKSGHSHESIRFEWRPKKHMTPHILAG
jgi:hypothetical protein